jgi:hypothetical protein
MKSLKRFDYLFLSTKGLILVAISMVALVTAIWGTLSGPMVEWGVRDITVKLLGMEMHHWEREGRVIMLYHTIAMSIVAIEVYMITSIVPMTKHQQLSINKSTTFGYLFAMIFGLGFAYFGHNFAFHGLFLVGQGLLFFAGISLASALWPWRKEYYLAQDSPYAHTKSGLDLERLAFFTMTVMTLLSAIWGAVTGSFWGNGHETFLGEDLIRIPHKTHLEHAIIGHLHIMVSLVAVAITLIVGRWLDFKGVLHKWGMYFMIIGSVVLTAGALAIVWLPWAHTIIYVGAVGVMGAALFYVIFSWHKLIVEGIADIENPTFMDKIKALIKDPLKFGPGWQMVFMNFTVSGIGIFMAIKLEPIFRVWDAREERISLVGHWHILAALIATIILMYYWDISGLKGKVRNWLGWLLIIGSDIAFASATIFSMKRLFVSEYNQGPVVSTTMLLIDFGLGAILIMLAIVLGWRLYDLFQKDGVWKKEAANPELDLNRILPKEPIKDTNVEGEVEK